MCMSACIWAELDAVVYGAPTTEDANWYWTESSDMTSRELTDRSRLDFSCELVPHVERRLCQRLFLPCDQVQAKLWPAVTTSSWRVFGLRIEVGECFFGIFSKFKAHAIKTT